MSGVPINNSHLCLCGCGFTTNLANANDPRFGHVIGKPMRYLRGHGNRKSFHRYEVNGTTGCWDWNGCIMLNGYGVQIRLFGRNISPHRLHYELKKGKIPHGLHIDHLCRNRKCVNPDHLEAVSHAENIRRGAGVKLNLVDAALIRLMASSGKKLSQIAKDFSVNYSTVWRISRNRIWVAL